MVSKMLLSSCELGCSEEIVIIAAMLSVQVSFSPLRLFSLNINKCEAVTYLCRTLKKKKVCPHKAIVFFSGFLNCPSCLSSTTAGFGNAPHGAQWSAYSNRMADSENKARFLNNFFFLVNRGYFRYFLNYIRCTLHTNLILTEKMIAYIYTF